MNKAKYKEFQDQSATIHNMSIRNPGKKFIEDNSINEKYSDSENFIVKNKIKKNPDKFLLGLRFLRYVSHTEGSRGLELHE